MNKIFINTDGGSRGNPGIAGIGISVSTEQGEIIHEECRFLGIRTNNEAEYQAVIDSLKWLLNSQSQLKPTSIVWRLDSMLVVEQLSRHWKIKEVRLQELAQTCWHLLAQISATTQFTYIPRAENARADSLANQAMDQAGEKQSLVFSE